MQSDAGAQSLFEDILKKYAAYKSFQARFVESSISRASGEGSPESGMVYFLRPGLWRWDYTAPERKVVIVRGKIASILVEGDREPTRYDLGDDGQRSGIGVLLAGGHEASAGFVARFEPVADRQAALLRLQPVKLSDEYDSVLLRVRAQDLTILEVVVVDPGGNTLRFQFTEFKPDHAMADSLFDLPAPAARP